MPDQLINWTPAKSTLTKGVDEPVFFDAEAVDSLSLEKIPLQQVQYSIISGPGVLNYGNELSLTASTGTVSVRATAPAINGYPEVTQDVEFTVLSGSVKQRSEKLAINLGKEEATMQSLLSSRAAHAAHLSRVTFTLGADSGSIEMTGPQGTSVVDIPYVLWLRRFLHRGTTVDLPTYLAEFHQNNVADKQDLDQIDL